MENPVDCKLCKNGLTTDKSKLCYTCRTDRIPRKILRFLFENTKTVGLSIGVSAEDTNNAIYQLLYALEERENS